MGRMEKDGSVRLSSSLVSDLSLSDTTLRTEPDPDPLSPMDLARTADG